MDIVQTTVLILILHCHLLPDRRACMITEEHVCSYSDFGGSAPAAKPPKSEGLRTIRKNSKIGGFASTAKTPKSEVLRSFKNISYNI